MTLIAAIALTAAASANTVTYQSRMGVNLSGCEFDGVGTLCPNNDDVDWYLSQGFSVIRLPFRSTIAPTKLYPIVDRIVAKGGTVILDRHDFAWPSVDAQVNFWASLVDRYKRNDRVMIDVMNEPKGFNDPSLPNDFMQWARDGNAIIAKLRAKGVTNTILLEWPQYSAAFRFAPWEAQLRECNSALCGLDRSGGLKDPLGRTLLSPHVYYDRWSSGVDAECELPFKLAEARVAAEQRGYRLWLGESAFGSYKNIRTSCAAYGAETLAEIKGNPGTWAGVSWWGGGRAWKEDYFYKIEPVKGTRAKVAPSAYLKAITR